MDPIGNGPDPVLALQNERSTPFRFYVQNQGPGSGTADPVGNGPDPDSVLQNKRSTLFSISCPDRVA